MNVIRYVRLGGREKICLLVALIIVLSLIIDLGTDGKIGFCRKGGT
jgi:hypothetical protein